jgi:hypothetical protein
MEEKKYEMAQTFGEDSGAGSMEQLLDLMKRRDSRRAGAVAVARSLGRISQGPGHCLTEDGKSIATRTGRALRCVMDLSTPAMVIDIVDDFSSATRSLPCSTVWRDDRIDRGTARRK